MRSVHAGFAGPRGSIREGDQRLHHVAHVLPQAALGHDPRDLQLAHLWTGNRRVVNRDSVQRTALMITFKVYWVSDSAD